MNLKEFLVIRNHDDNMEVWARAEYEKYIHETLFVGACPAVAIVTHFNEDERLLAGEELKEGGGMRWVKASEFTDRLHWRIQCGRIIRNGIVDKYTQVMWDDVERVWIINARDKIERPEFLEILDEYAAQFAGTGEDWVSVRSMPEDEKSASWEQRSETYNICVTTPAGHIHVSCGYLQNEKWHWVEGKKPMSSDFIVTHYRKLPNPPNTNI